jgi:hypothetical protein
MESQSPERCFERPSTRRPLSKCTKFSKCELFHIYFMVISVSRFAGSRRRHRHPQVATWPVAAGARALTSSGFQLASRLMRTSKPFTPGYGGRTDFRLANVCRRLDVHDHRVLQVDEIVVGVGVDGGGVGRCHISAAGSVGEIDFDSTGVAPPKAASSRTERYSATSDWTSGRGPRLWRRRAAAGLLGGALGRGPARPPALRREGLRR